MSTLTNVNSPEVVAGTDPCDVSTQGESRMHLDSSLLIFLTLVLTIFVVVHHHLDARFDFGVFYYAAHMVLDGSRHALYDFGAQHVFQAHFHRPPETLFRNPPVTLIPILIIAKLPMLVAFSVWTALEMALLILSLKRLEIETKISYGNWPILLSLAYVPVMGCMLHGQFSILILASYVFAYSQWRRGRRFIGGAILSIATLKFQLVIGFIAVLLLKRKWRELGGFATGSAVLLILSAFITGIPALLTYPKFVLHSDSPISELNRYANWQGLLSLFGQNHLWLAVLLSIVTVLWAAWTWENDLDRGFCAAILASMLVTYHFTPQDLALSLIPFYLCAKTGLLPQSRIPLFVFLSLLVTTMMVADDIPLALLSIPLIVALWWVGEKKMPKVEGWLAHQAH
jgi:hypothetical protein